MTLSGRVEMHRDEIRTIAERHGAHRIRVFGSVARGEDEEGSDLDLLVEFELGRSLMDQVALMLELEDLLESRVDIVDVVALHPSIKQRILAEAVAL